MATKTFERIIEREAPETKHVQAQEYLHTPLAGAIVPLIQAAITGGMLSFIVLVVLVWARVRPWPQITLLVFCLATAGTWLLLQVHWFGLTQVRPGIEGQQQSKPKQSTQHHTVKVDLAGRTQDGYYHSEQAEFTITESQLSELAAGLLDGKPLSEREWTGEGKPLSIGQFRQFRAECIKRKLIQLVNPKAPTQGFELTRTGRAMMRYFANLTPHSPTGQDDYIEGEITE